MVFPTLAEPLNYRDYETGVTVDGSNDIVHVSLPVDMTTFQLLQGDEIVKSAVGVSSFGWDPLPGVPYYLDIQMVTDGISIHNIPADSKISADLRFFGYGADMANSQIWSGIYTFNSSGERSYSGGYSSTVIPLDGSPVSFEFGFGSSSDTVSFYPSVAVYDFVSTSNDSIFWLDVVSVKLDISISSLYRLQEQTGQTNELLEEVNKQLVEQGKTIEDILNQQEQTNDKLDQLPGQIGDEMQGVIDSEKEQSKSEGNKFVDQILDALPDPSTDVLAALKSLTDATAYTGTDAVLPIPAIVLPGIDGLFPETEIYGGTDFDLGSYIELLSPTLLTLSQSLFTIAIVLYCVYELKGIISYCLTLRESKGG